MRTYATKACELDSTFGCCALGASYKFAKQDFKKAKKYYEKSCDGKDGGGCYNISILYEHAQGLSQDIALAKEYSKRSCDYGFKAGCENLKNLSQYTENEQLTQYGTMLKEDCEMGLGIACGNLLTYYYHGFGGANKNHTQARILLQKGCKLQDTTSFYNLGLWEMQGLGGTNKNAKKALEHINFACKNDVKNSCKALENLDENKKYLYKCEDNAMNIANAACSTTGAIYENGLDSVKSDIQLALKYYKRACDGGLDNACTLYQNLQQKVK